MSRPAGKAMVIERAVDMNGMCRPDRESAIP